MNQTEIHNPWNPELYLKAWNLAAKLHKGQTYGGPNKGEQIDYLCHIGAVAMETITALQHTAESLDADLAIQSALLHDTIEDTEASPEMIREQFGEEVLQGVLALTKNTAVGDKKAQMRDSLTRIRACPPEIWMVKMADRICNLQEPPFYWDDRKKKLYAEEGAFILETLGEANEWLAERLRQRIERYAQFYES